MSIGPMSRCRNFIDVESQKPRVISLSEESVGYIAVDVAHYFMQRPQLLTENEKALVSIFLGNESKQQLTQYIQRFPLPNPEPEVLPSDCNMEKIMEFEEIAKKYRCTLEKCKALHSFLLSNPLVIQSNNSPLTYLVPFDQQYKQKYSDLMSDPIEECVNGPMVKLFVVSKRGLLAIEQRIQEYARQSAENSIEFPRRLRESNLSSCYDNSFPTRSTTSSENEYTPSAGDSKKISCPCTIS